MFVIQLPGYVHQHDVPKRPIKENARFKKMQILVVLKLTDQVSFTLNCIIACFCNVLFGQETIYYSWSPLIQWTKKKSKQLPAKQKKKQHRFKLREHCNHYTHLLKPFVFASYINIFHWLHFDPIYA